MFSVCMGKIQVVMDPKQRKEYLRYLLKLDGLTHIIEDPNGAYTFISLTNTPNELKSILKGRQKQLKGVLRRAKINIYNPGDSSKYNPDFNLDVDMAEVYLADTIEVLSNRFFTGHVIVPSLGQGNEAEKARNFNRISVMFIDKNIRVSRMQPFRSIYIGYDNFKDQTNEFVQVFEMLKEYEPGMGFHNNIPVLLGFKKNKPIDLEEAVYNEFPNLKFHYDGGAPLLELRAKNPEIFYENKK